MIKRIFLFVATNLLVMLTISILLSILGVQPYLTRNGIDYYNLMLFCFVWGMGGAFISLAMSRMMAKWMMGVKVLEPGQAGSYDQLIQMVHQLARSAGIAKMPQVGVYDSPEVNAFATGPTKNRALVAFSTGLLNSMSRAELEGVAGHEIAHIKNGDMVTMTLIQGVVNAFVMFLSRVIAFAASQAVKEEQARMVNFAVRILLDIVLGLFGSMVVAWFSRQREFRADAGSAQLAGRNNMIAALQKLGQLYNRRSGFEQNNAIAALKISGQQGGFLAMLATHPSLESRIARLQGFQA